MGNGETKDVVQGIFTLFWYVVMPAILLGATWITQHNIVRARRKMLSEQEEYFRKRIPLTNLKQFPAGSSSATLVSGAVVIADNYFISFVAGFKHLFGGEMKGYTGMCSDARRIALVRMLQEAEAAPAAGTATAAQLTRVTQMRMHRDSLQVQFDVLCAKVKYIKKRQMQK